VVALYRNGAVTVVPRVRGASTIPLHDRSTVAPVLHDTDHMTAASYGSWLLCFMTLAP